jgi:hypothetical protein
MEFGIEPREKSRPMWPFLLAGAAMVVLALIGFGLFSHQTVTRAPRTKPLPFGRAEQSYAANVRFQDLKMSRFENMLHQQVTYLVGNIENTGNRTIGDLEITVEFRNVQNQVVLRQSVRPLESRPVPIQAGQQRAFQVGFDGVPADWNEQYPAIRVSGLVLE